MVYQSGGADVNGLNILEMDWMGRAKFFLITDYGLIQSAFNVYNWRHCEKSETNKKA